MDKRANPRAVLVAACLGFLVVQLDASVVNVALGALRSAFDVDIGGLQWVINSYALSFSALLILAGALGDRWGARQVFLAGFGIFTVASVACGLSTSITMLVAMRGMQGVGAAFVIPTSLTLIRVSFPDATARRSAVALWGACGGIAVAAGPVVGGLLIERFGWPSVFMINIPLGAIAICLTTSSTVDSARISRTLDPAGQTAMAVSLVLLTYGLTEIASRGWTSLPQTTLTMAAVCMAIFVVIERHVSSPMLPARLARNRVLVATMVTGAFINLSFFGLVFVLSIYFQTVRHLDAVHTGLAFVPLTAVMAVSSLLSARLSGDRNPFTIMAAGLGLQIVGFLLLAQVTATSPTLLDVALAMVGVGSASTVPAMNNAMLASVGHDDTGTASGLMSSARQTGGIIGVAVFGALISSATEAGFTIGMSTSMKICAVMLAVCVACNAILQGRQNKSVISPTNERST